jgi:hypothetical protein
VYCSSEYEPYDSVAKLHDLTEKKVKTYDRYSKIICNVPSAGCYQGDCEMCLGSENLIINIEQRFEENKIDLQTMGSENLIISIEQRFEENNIDLQTMDDH